MAKKSTITDKSAFIEAVNDLAKKQVREAALKAKRDLAIQRVQEQHSPEIELVGSEIKDLLADVRLYAEDNRAEVFDPGSKTEKTELAIYRFFLTPPKIGTLNRKFDDDRCIALMEQSTRLAPFVRPKKEIDRESLLSAIAEKNLTPADLEVVGLKHSQTEKFEVKPLVESGEKISV